MQNGHFSFSQNFPCFNTIAWLACCYEQDQLEQLRMKMGATLSERYTTTQKGTAKMMTDYEKMRKDLMKVCHYFRLGTIFSSVKKCSLFPIFSIFDIIWEISE